VQILRDEALQPYNTLALEASAAALVRVGSDEELSAAISWASEQALPVVPLGAGSNIVLAGDMDAVVVHQQTRGIEVIKAAGDKVSLRVAAGENWHGLVQWSLRNGLSGLENLALIPGTVGAAPIQNIGAYGVELQSSLLRVHAMNVSDGQRVIVTVYSSSDCVTKWLLPPWNCSFRGYLNYTRNTRPWPFFLRTRLWQHRRHRMSLTQWSVFAAVNYLIPR